MKRVFADKIASVALGCRLTPDVRLSDEIPSEEGVVIAVEVQDDKTSYNQLELASGRMASVRKGDVLVGALGHRKALFGYSGHVPETLQPGDLVHLLNLGGVLGVCDDYDRARGAPFPCRVLGAVLSFPFLGERIGVPARVGGFEIDRGAPSSSADSRSSPSPGRAWTRGRPRRRARFWLDSAIGALRSTRSRQREFRLGGTSWRWKMRAPAPR